jgi:AcrR family transcriptional regulator
MRADARRNRQLLLAAAMDAFAEHGADDASLDEIARRAGVGIGTLYRHFPDRRALHRWVRAMMNFGATKRNLAGSLMSGPEKSEVALSCSTMVREAAGMLLAAAQRSGEIRPDVDATDLLRLSHAITLAAELPSQHPDQAERLMTVMLDGLRAASPAPATGPPAGTAG